MMLGNVLPIPAALNVADSGRVNAILRGDDAVNPRICADSMNIRLGQFREVVALTFGHGLRLGARPMLVAFRWLAASFRVHIRDVLGVGSGIQMIGVAAARVVARMATEKSIRVPPVDSHRNAVRAIRPIVNRKAAVSAFVRISAPRPAIVCATHINARPKAFALLFGQFGYRSSHGSRSPVRSVTGRWKRCRHIISSRNVTMWQGGVPSHFSAL